MDCFQDGITFKASFMFSQSFVGIFMQQLNNLKITFRGRLLFVIQNVFLSHQCWGKNKLERLCPESVFILFQCLKQDDGTTHLYDRKIVL